MDNYGIFFENEWKLVRNAHTLIVNCPFSIVNSSLLAYCKVTM